MELYRYVMDYGNILDDLEEVFKKMKKEEDFHLKPDEFFEYVDKAQEARGNIREIIEILKKINDREADFEQDKRRAEAVKKMINEFDDTPKIPF